MLYPNTIVGVHYDHLWTVWLEPLAADKTVERMTIYYADPAVRGDDYAELRRAVHKEWQKIWAEDQGVVEGMQRGRGSPAFDGGVFTPQFDDPTHHLHRWVAGRLSRELGAFRSTASPSLRAQRSNPDSVFLDCRAGCSPARNDDFYLSSGVQAPSRRGRSPKRPIRLKIVTLITTKSTATEAMTGV